jgi:flagellar basal body-associated protein FliL
MEKEKKQNNKLLFILILVIIIISTVLYLVITNLNRKSYDIYEVEKEFCKYYSDIELESKTDEEIMHYFSIPINSSDKAILLSNFDPNIEIGEESKEPNLLLLFTDLDKNRLNEYYESLEGFIGSYTNKYDKDTENKLIELYSNSILKKGNNYFYLLIGTKNGEFEEELNRFYK